MHLRFNGGPPVPIPESGVDEVDRTVHINGLVNHVQPQWLYESMVDELTAGLVQAMSMKLKHTGKDKHPFVIVQCFTAQQAARASIWFNCNPRHETWTWQWASSTYNARPGLRAAVTDRSSPFQALNPDDPQL